MATTRSKRSTSRRGTSARSPSSRSSSSRSTSARSTSARSTSARSASSGGSTRRTSKRRYGEAASKKVARALREAKRGQLRSGRSKKKVTSRKQAIAIGLSQARQRGAKVPARKSSGR